MTNVGIIVNVTKDPEFKMTQLLINWFEKNNASVMLDYKTADFIHRDDLGYDDSIIFEKAAFLIVLGGDGTLLGAAGKVLSYETPILGINMGHLGFITELDSEDILPSLKKVLSGDYRIESRMMLEASVIRKDSAVKNFYCLNEFGIAKGVFSKLVFIKTYVGEEFLGTYNADGLLISTPTGSTAYSLSAGGPIINPRVNVMLITPVCPHSLNSRAIVVGDHEVIRVNIEDNEQDVYLTADGQKGCQLTNGDSILIKKAPFSVKLIKVSNRSYYDILRTKLKER